MSTDASAVNTPATLVPTGAAERIVTLDILRGLALLGVLIANITFDFGGLRFVPWEAQKEMMRQWSLDSAIYHFDMLFISGKARTIFAFLFGLGFAVLLLRAEARGRSIVPVYARRLGVLLVIGLLHKLLFWGDVVANYAALGFLLLLVYRSSNRTLLAWSAVLLLVVPAIRAALPFVMALLSPDGGSAGDPTTRTAVLAAFASGDPAQIFEANLQALRLWWTPPSFALLIMLETLGTFLVGLYVGRRRVFENPDAFRGVLRALVIRGLPLGLALSVVTFLAFSELMPQAFYQYPVWLLVPLMTGLQSTGMLLMAAGYVAAVTLMLERVRGKALLGHFAPVGRMALTNYLLQSVICVVVVYGGGLTGNAGPALLLALAMVIFPAQMAFSAWWLSRYRFGPMEWLWRSLTYGQLQPMRIGELVPVPVGVEAPRR